METSEKWIIGIFQENIRSEKSAVFVSGDYRQKYKLKILEGHSAHLILKIIDNGPETAETFVSVHSFSSKS